jgi:nucleosome binding factor SPN SPT16 subunit
MAAFKQIKELIRNVKIKETEESSKQEVVNEELNEDLILIKGKKELLENLVIRPNIVGKKTVGQLEVHQNGVRFISQKGHSVDIAFSNIKHAFFQPCAEDELIIIIHFNLKTPIMVGTKKVTDVQFFKETGNVSDDIDGRGARKRLNDMDELEQEERERQLKIKLNNRFQNFVK